MRKTELLIPAGSLDTLKTAVNYGADAVYLGGEAFGLRAKAKNFTNEEIREGIKFAHEHGVRVYITANIFAHNRDLDGVEEYFRELKEIGPDALIISDPGVFSIARRVLPGMEIHISTQASIVSYQAARAWHDLGADRVILARELTLEEIAEIRAKTPASLEIETFAHGAMCVSYSGRCLLSNYMTGRDANRGACAQPCRYQYALVEEKRPGAYYPIEEDVRGTYVMNAHDLCMIEHLDELAQAGVSSFKIEGRNKRAFYVATAVHAYRAVMDGANPSTVMSDLHAISHRPYGTGFYFGQPSQRQERDGYDKDYLHAATVTACGPAGEGGWRIEATCHNRFREGDELEALSPRKAIETAKVRCLTWLVQPSEDRPNPSPEPVPVANRTMETYAFTSDIALQPGDLLRIRVDSAPQGAQEVRS